MEKKHSKFSIIQAYRFSGKRLYENILLVFGGAGIGIGLIFVGMLIWALSLGLLAYVYNSSFALPAIAQSLIGSLDKVTSWQTFLVWFGQVSETGILRWWWLSVLWVLLPFAIMFVFQSVVFIGWNRLGFAWFRNESTDSVGIFLRNFKKVPAYLATLCIVVGIKWCLGLAYILGFVLAAMLPSISFKLLAALGASFLLGLHVYVSIRLRFAYMAVIENNGRVFAALAHSWDVTQGHVGKIIGFMLFAWVLFFVPLLFLTIPAVVTILHVVFMYLYFFAHIYLYKTLELQKA